MFRRVMTTEEVENRLPFFFTQVSLNRHAGLKLMIAFSHLPEWGLPASMNMSSWRQTDFEEQAFTTILEGFWRSALTCQTQYRCIIFISYCDTFSSYYINQMTQ